MDKETPRDCNISFHGWPKRECQTLVEIVDKAISGEEVVDGVLEVKLKG